MVTQIATTNGFKPSAYQIAIYDFVKRSLTEQRRNLVISAKAGTGKSSTVAGANMMEVIPPYMTVLYLTFMREVNLDLDDKVKHSKEVLAGRAPQAGVRTCHSIGNGCLKDIGIVGDPSKNGRKYNHLCQQYLKEHMAEYDYKLSEQLAELVNKVRLTLANTSEASLKAIIRRYNIDIDTTDEEIWPIILQAVPFILQAGIKQAQREGKFDFTDQIWLPSSKALDLQPSKYDIVMIDEAQDLSPCIRELALKTVRKSGMVISVGDPNQAIMAFAGASPRSLEELREATNAAILPLNKNYRCPKSVIRLAQRIVPEIEVWEGAEEGEVNYITHNDVSILAQMGDMILCRYNAPLVEMAISLIKMRKRCIVKGRDLGGNVTSFLEKVTKFYQEGAYKFHPVQPEILYTELVKHVNEYQSRMLSILTQNEEENENRISKLDDDCETLLALFEGYQEENEKGSYQGFVTFIENFFKEHGETTGEVRGNARKYTITLSTGHKAKGLENPNVFILGYDELPSSKAKTEEAIEQENNLLYVMITRPQKKLYCVVKEPEMYQAEKDFTMGIVPQVLPEIEEEEVSSLVASYLEIGKQYEEAVQAEYEEVLDSIVEHPIVDAPVTLPDEQQTVETVETSQGAKRTYGGRKPLPSEDKRVFFQSTWDVSIRQAFKSFTEAQNAENGTNLSEGDMLEQIVLSNPQFAAFFQQSEQHQAYQDRLARAEQRREAYANRKRTKKVEKPEEDNQPDPDNNPDGSGQPAASNPETTEQAIEPVQLLTEETYNHYYGAEEPEEEKVCFNLACQSPNVVIHVFNQEFQKEAWYCQECWDSQQAFKRNIGDEIIEVMPATSLFPAAIPDTGKVKRVAYTCLSKRCHKSWLTDYYQDANGHLFRMVDGQVRYQHDDFLECPHCKNSSQYIKVTYPKMKHSGTRKCDSRCQNAKPGSPCVCSCGGIAHATGHGANIIGQPLLQLINEKKEEN